MNISVKDTHTDPQPPPWVSEVDKTMHRATLLQFLVQNTLVQTKKFPPHKSITYNSYICY